MNKRGARHRAGTGGPPRRRAEPCTPTRWTRPGVALEELVMVALRTRRSSQKRAAWPHHRSAARQLRRGGADEQDRARGVGIHRAHRCDGGIIQAIERAIRRRNQRGAYRFQRALTAATSYGRVNNIRPETAVPTLKIDADIRRSNPLGSARGRRRAPEPRRGRRPLRVPRRRSGENVMPPITRSGEKGVTMGEDLRRLPQTSASTAIRLM